MALDLPETVAHLVHHLQIQISEFAKISFILSKIEGIEGLRGDSQIVVKFFKIFVVFVGKSLSEERENHLDFLVFDPF